MHKQEVFDTVIAHLLSMTHRSSNGAKCLYRADDGNACAVGCLLSDQQAKSLDNVGNNSVDYLIRNRLFPPSLVPHRGLLIDLQNVHDFVGNWDKHGDGPIRKEQVVVYFQNIACKHGVRFNVHESAEA